MQEVEREKKRVESKGKREKKLKKRGSSLAPLKA